MPENQGFLSKFLKSLFGQAKAASQPPRQAPTPAQKPPASTPPVQGAPTGAGSGSGQIDPRRIWSGVGQLSRRRYLWGADGENNPCFLLLYGQHTYQNYQNDYLLDEAVAYTHYLIIRGKGGHFPAFDALKVMTNTNYRTRETTTRIYYKKDMKNRYWADPEDAIPDFVELESPISIPHFSKISHEACVDIIEAQSIAFSNFAPVNTPSDILRLNTELLPYQDELVTLLSNPGIYMRKKALWALMDKKPPKALWTYLLRVGSSELVAGLYLEFALRADDSLLEEARAAQDGVHEWTAESYADGIRRVAGIYVNAFRERVAKQRVDALRETLSELQFYPAKVENREIPEDKILEGATMRKYALRGLLTDHFYQYNREERRSVRCRREGLYHSGYYSDGTSLDRIRLKSTIQESQVYGAADILGKVAYYLDAPGLVYYFRGNGQSSALHYFQRYLNRVFKEYARQDEAKFMDAMVALFTGYTPADYCCKCAGNFQFNYFIKQYLYHSFDNTPPTSWRSRYQFMMNDQLAKLEGRYEFMPDIWNRHLDRVVEIALGAKIDTILKAVYYILCDPANGGALDKLTYEQLLKLAASEYGPLAEMGASMIARRLAGEQEFRAEIMALLMRSQSQAVRSLAQAYFQRADGAFSPVDLAGLLLMPDLQSWEEMICQNIERLDGDGYVAFLREVMAVADQFAQSDWEGPLADILNSTMHKFDDVSAEKKAGMITAALERVQAGGLPEPLLDFMEKIIFAPPVAELRQIVQGAVLPGSVSASLLSAIRSGTVPADGDILSILEGKGAAMVRSLTELLVEAADSLRERHSTLMMLLECDQSALNALAKSVFEGLTGDEQKALHAMILDSPHAKAYTYGMQKLYDLYESRDALIPEEYIRKMMEHSSPEVKRFIADKIDHALESLGAGNTELFLYYAKTLLLLPNRLAAGKEKVYAALPRFVEQYREKQPNVEALLLQIGGSNTICDCERALVALAQIRKEAV